MLDMCCILCMFYTNKDVTPLSTVHPTIIGGSAAVIGAHGFKPTVMSYRLVVSCIGVSIYICI